MDDKVRKANSPISLNSMQLAILSLKEKCQKQQKKIDELEEENLSITASKTSIYQEVKKLHETNEKLREKNLQLSASLQQKSMECTELAQKLEDRRLNENISARQIERLQNQVAIITHRDLSSDPCSLISLSEEARESLPTDTFSLADTKSLVEKVENNFTSIKEKLLAEQRKLQTAVQVLQQNKTNSDRKVESLISASLSAVSKKTETKLSRCRQCPMCEAEFPLDVSQDEFECHVVEHFSYDEAETLKHFDFVPDAYWSCHNSHTSIDGNLSSS